MKILILLTLALVPHDEVVTDDVDLVEINHFYDNEGRLILDQIIWYNLVHVVYKGDDGTIYRTSEYHCVAWRLLKECRDDTNRTVLEALWKERWKKETPGKIAPPYTNPFIIGSMIPIKNRATGLWVSRWVDGSNSRKVTAKVRSETWTQHDPELKNRDFLSKDKRVGLGKLRIPKRAATPLLLLECDLCSECHVLYDEVVGGEDE